MLIANYIETCSYQHYNFICTVQQTNANAFMWGGGGGGSYEWGGGGGVTNDGPGISTEP